MSRLLLVALMVLLSAASPALSQERPAADTTLSPYFFVKSGDASLDQFPLKSTSAEVDITGVIARVRVTQVYANQGKRPLEAIYIFPASTRAAVHAMKMTIGERVITAQIEERQEARRQYEAARDAGRTASLLEQQRPNVFQMNVANILPGDEVKVDLAYTELLVPEKGIYEFIYPTVVGPRYSNTPAEGAPESARWVQNPYLRKGSANPVSFELKGRIVTGIPLRDVTCPSHQMTIEFPARDRATIALPAVAKGAGNRDVVVRYRLAETQIETGVLVSQGPDENFFVCMVEPPRRVNPGAVPPREYVFIMDVSGSMSGFPIETSKELFRNLLGRLQPTDHFNVLFFSGGSYVLSPTSLEATEWNKNRALQEIAQQRGGGGTELLPALRRAFDLPRARPDVSRVIVIATDGYVNVERAAFALVRDRLRDANVFTFGIGSSVNRHLIEGMARVGEGLPFVVLDAGKAEATAARFVEYIESPLLTHVEVRFSGFPAYDLEPATLPDLFAERPLVLAGKFHGEPGGTITISGFTGAGRFERTLKVTKDQASQGNDALRYLWARERLTLLSDYGIGGGADAAAREEVTRLGLKYNLLTEFTSFVAVDQHVRRQDGKLETVKQPLPLPTGVSNLAVGGSAQAGVAGALAIAAPGAATRGVARAADALVTESVIVNDPRAKQGSLNTLRIEVPEIRLTGASIRDRTVQERTQRAFAGVQPCVTGVRFTTPLRLKVYFNGTARVDRVELLEPERWKTTLSLANCVRTAIERSLALPAPAKGYLVIAVRW